MYYISSLVPDLYPNLWYEMRGVTMQFFLSCREEPGNKAITFQFERIGIRNKMV